ncbi:MerR family transcriptional regulator [Ruminococcaceae bacterium OttesenSCG-928-I18]|nr:MerR family transcriptional regulator [Ruminococcaceae bacterium OttesenSCG-928-I18]
MSVRRYTIGDLSDISGISKRTLRLYDEKELLKPSERDDENNYRLYSEQQVVDALMIREMKRRGFSMSEIKSLLQSHDLRELKKELDEKITSLEAEVGKIQEQLAYTRVTKDLITKALYFYDEALEKKSNEIVVDKMPDMTILFDRRHCHVNANHLFWDRYNDLQLLREKEQVTAAGPFSAIFYDHYFNQFFFDEGDLEVYLPIQETNRESPNIRVIQGFERASMIFVGWYSELLATYVELVKQIEKKGYRIAGPSYEEYLVEFSYGVSEENCVTRVSFPVEKM